MNELKSSKQVLGIEAYLGMQQFAPPALLAQAARLNFSTRLFNLIVTNVPGPQFPLHMLGRELVSFLPIAPTPQAYLQRALALTGDPAALAALRRELPDRLFRSPICQPQARAAAVEAHYRSCWQAWCAQQKSR